MAATTTLTWDDERLRRDRIALLQAEMRRRNVGALYLRDIYQRSCRRRASLSPSSCLGISAL
ncbi:MAG: hypothetical protein HW416_2491 [Chloroflexi bacterium]|nr:hypothetical protein [Chloroflexota bacterium]